MSAIEQISVVLRQQADAIKKVEAYPVISNCLQPNTATTIPNSHHPTPNIIEMTTDILHHCRE